MESKKVNQFIAFLITICFVFPSFAAQKAVVRTDGAMVYKAASFDADVIGYLNSNDPVMLSSKRFGVFYRLRMKNGKMGYISDVDVEVEGKPLAAEKKRKSEEKEEPEQEEEDHRPMFYRQYLGAIGGIAKYAEKLAGAKPSEDLFMYGIKVTGPDLLMSLPLDVTLLTHVGAPSYYSDLSDGVRPSGWLVMLDAQLIYPFMAEDSSAAYFGLGPLFVYSRFDILKSDTRFELEEIKLGAVFSLNYGVSFGKWALRADLRYFWERERYLGYNLSLQHEL